ncbi:hypothetical protein TTHERM_00409020 (macronuclear) [Tetrahymena thermophila SB210]|uniref:Uncharacterized protein n=1 Tax=Tetrahymena thermophila (strain SB210) TaxID=312017 RepID=I7MFS5_TETTS|nr:hypothetical protein TTHERM_00409020 [Tetrahymena thermophila SB210]EAS00549.2 hypothetical protein TTHERM_00409020 [Tetrahymena thermophila SB210]|eukprot:XP_001020794.2 hypothetical protein TTHERM_00409020 [Tetrahymena thermophila SB210]
MNNLNNPKYPPGVASHNRKKNNQRNFNNQSQNYHNRDHYQHDNNNNFMNNFQMGQQDISDIISSLGNQFSVQIDPHHNQQERLIENQEIQFVNVNDLEQKALVQQSQQNINDQQPEQEESQKVKQFLMELKECLRKKCDIIIEIGKRKIDEMEKYIENRIKEKICSKVMEGVYDKEKAIFKEIFQNELLNKNYLRDQIISCMEQHFKEYFQEVSKVYELGLKHFSDYCKESENVSKQNKETFQSIILELQNLQEGDRNILAKLQDQTKEELDEINNMRQINENISKYVQGIAIIKEKNAQLENYLQNLQLKVNDRVKQNKLIVDYMVSKYIEEYQKALVAKRKNLNTQKDGEDSDDEESEEEESPAVNQKLLKDNLKPPVQIITKQTQQIQNLQARQNDQFFQDEESNDEEEDEEEEEENKYDQTQENIKIQYLKNVIEDDYQEDQQRKSNQRQQVDRNQYRQNYTNNFDLGQLKNNQQNQVETDDEDSVSDN